MEGPVRPNAKDQAEIERIEAEKEHLQALKRKTVFEIEEMQTRKNSIWHRWRILIQGIIAGLVTSGLLAVWLIGYWQPIISVETEKGQIQDEINNLEIKLITLKQDSLDNQNDILNLERISLLAQRDSLLNSINQVALDYSKMKSELANQKSELTKLLASINDDQSNSNLRTQVQNSIKTIESAESSAKKTSIKLDEQKLRILSHYELNFDQPIGANSSKEEIRKIQEWLNLQKRVNENWTISVGMDGDYNEQTIAAVKEFQKTKGLTPDGIVGRQTYYQLTAPMSSALIELDARETFAETLIAYAEQHLAQSPSEFQQNEGPWVRLYMDGNEGPAWAWTVGFVKFVLGQACQSHSIEATDILPRTYSADVWGEYANERGMLRRNSSDYTPKPGDFFLIVKKPWDWTHTGIITGVDGGWIHTIEGNTNDEGTRYGYEVCARQRNYKTNNIDFIDLKSVTSMEHK